jgi:hypothetical protein
MSLLLLGPVAFGASVLAADDPAPGTEIAAPAEVLAKGAPTEGGEETGEEGDHGTGEEGDHGEETATLICLATGDRDAPYTAALVMPTAIISGEGQVKKEGPAGSPVEGVFPAEAWGNIVPEVAHPSGATFAGLNFGPDGKTIWDNGCGIGEPGTPPDEGHDDDGHGGHATAIVCVATEDSVIPYLVEEWMVQEIINGHGMPKKDGPASDPVYGVFPDAVWGNIIPVVTHPNKKATYPGLNLEDGGQAILDAGCVYVVPAAPAPAPGPAPAAKDFCPDLDGVQWENYDCNTPQVAAAEAAAPAEPTVAVVTAPEASPAPASAAMPAEVAVPTEQSIPTAVDAGNAPDSPDGAPAWAILMLAAGCLGAAVAATRMAASEPV